MGGDGYKICGDGWDGCNFCPRAGGLYYTPLAVNQTLLHQYNKHFMGCGAQLA